MDNEKDELDELIVDENQVIDKGLLRDIIKPYLMITNEGGVIFKNPFDKQTGAKKILIYILARKVMKIKNVGNLKHENVNQKDISEKTNIADYNVRSYIATPLKGIVLRDENGYFIPNYNLIRVKNLLISGSNGNK